MLERATRLRKSEGFSKCLSRHAKFSLSAAKRGKAAGRSEDNEKILCSCWANYVIMLVG